MRIASLVVWALLLLSAPVFAATAAPKSFDTPKALLDYAYAPYATGQFEDDNNNLYSRALNAMFAAADAATPDDEVGPVDFDVFVDGQDYQLSGLTIGDPTPEPGGVTVPVSFKNFDTAESLVFHMIQEGGSWRINDIESKTPGSEWRLTTLLTPDPNADAGQATDADGASPESGSTGSGDSGANSGSN